jgi:hypothetical protein
MKRRSFAVVAVAGSALLAGIVVAPASAQADEPQECAAPAVVTVDGLSAVSEEGCIYPDTVIRVGAAQDFAVPEPGISVQLEALRVEGASQAGAEVWVFRGEDGQAAVAVDGDLYGSPEAAGDLSSMIENTEEAPDADSSEAGTQAIQAACTNADYATTGSKWIETFRWRYNPANQASTNSGAIMQESAKKWNGTPGNCSPRVSNSSSSSYSGTTTARPSVTAALACSSNDGSSTVGWGGTFRNVLGAALDSDQLYDTGFSWNTASACSSGYDLRGVSVHEFGHSYGLGHSPQGSGQVMKPNSPTCDTAQRVVGLGDAFGMAAIYPQ